MNGRWDVELFSTKLDIPNDVLVDFIAMNLIYHVDKIINLNENIQQIELMHMVEHLSRLRKAT